MSTHTSIVGTIGGDPRLTTTQGNAAYCTFRVASNERRYDAEKQEWIDGETSWFTVNAFRGLAEHASASLRKGDRVIVNGRLRIRQWETSERAGTTAIIDADALGPDLRFGTTQFSKMTRSARWATDNAADRSAGEAADAAASEAVDPPADDTANEPGGGFSSIGAAATQTATGSVL